MSDTIRTRFAPSPTGFLHIGGARTALFSWLFARHFKGEFLLRIEDTDRERHNEEAVQAIMDGMQWLGLNYDGEEISRQSMRYARYMEAMQRLLASGKAYRCYCTKERLDNLRKEQMANKQKPKYDGYCRYHDDHDKTVLPVIRFKNPTEGAVEFDDLVRGKITTQNSELDDLIIARSDGTPTYNFTVVVDDWDMSVTHVIRGDDHINNTPRQINLLNALGAPRPTYGHVPSILAENGKKLSKRDGAANLLDYRTQGFLPEAVLNYLVRLGWSHGDQELFSVEQMIEFFDGSCINNSPAKLSQEKLLWLNQHYLMQMDIEKIIPLFEEQLNLLNIKRQHQPDLMLLISLQRERAKTLREMAEMSAYFFDDIKEFDEKACNKHMTDDAKTMLKTVHEKLSELSDWEKEPIHDVIKSVAEQFELKLGKVAQPIRIAVTGGVVSPPIDVTLQLLGKELVLARLDGFTYDH